MDGLAAEYNLLHLIYYKNRNQHHTQQWWKQFSMLHRRVRQLLRRYNRAVASFVVHKLIPSFYLQLHSLLAQGSFVTLGFSLIACIAKIRAVIEPRVRIAAKPSGLPREALPDLGEIVDRASLSATNKPKSAPVAKKKEKKRKRDAIDDIFG